MEVKIKMDFAMIASKLASEYDFQTKMKINKLVLEEVAREAGVDRSQLNGVAFELAESPIHNQVQDLANSINAEASRIKKGNISKSASGFHLVDNEEYPCHISLSISIDFSGSSHVHPSDIKRKLNIELKDSIERALNLTARDLKLDYDSAVVGPIKIQCKSSK